jgi:hypothetical protein
MTPEHHSLSLHSQECRKGAADARSTPRRDHFFFRHPPDLHLVGRIDAFVAEASSLLESPDLASTVWAALTLAFATSTNNNNAAAWGAAPAPYSRRSWSPKLASTWWVAPSARDAEPTPPPPYSRRSWPRFFALLPPPTVEAVLAKTGDATACISFLASRRGRQVAGAGALWPIRDTLRDFLVHQQPSVRRALQQRTWW